MTNNKNILFVAILLSGTAVMVSLFSATAFAKRKGEVPISMWGGDRLYADCMLTSDSKNKSGRTYDRCCSKSLGYCIKCPKTKTVGNMCMKSPYIVVNSPPGKIDNTGGDVFAPTKDKPKQKFPSKMKNFPNNSNGAIKN